MAVSFLDVLVFWVINIKLLFMQVILLIYIKYFLTLDQRKFEKSAESTTCNEQLVQPTIRETIENLIY